mmetsp:Transcript_5884/g.10047  ORF Transcript_5884/g.10047 Transcript_5884/m.10047 type:complete len:175 (-) Transcript_5884:146-670(-)
MKGPLTDFEQQTLLKMLVKDPELALHIGMNPTLLQDLINHNKSLARELIILLNGQISIEQYLDALTHMKPSFISFEFFHGLSQKLKLPHQFITKFNIHKMNDCRSPELKEKDKHRMARIVSVFITNQLKERRNLRISTQLFNEIQRFCLDFSKVKEAGDLHKLIAAENYMKQSN